ncbi:hypothetical protein CERSUDRAFT_117965 [Gelatoporia subvermispora B]|uniref:Golgi apparatus membrane protein TVP38 n=1 Tax=Ceriporiopsis subvermispora (strain B) TaxID=914234 RepID=M2R362_CERS8|nr:hypothetical protein CERSUDRAFT_117965 [Gelatoporia subvermispora B]
MPWFLPSSFALGDIFLSSKAPGRLVVSYLTMSHPYKKILEDDDQAVPMITKVAYTDPHVQLPPYRASSPDPSMSFRELARTPSPTPSEDEALHPVPFDPRSILTKEFWFSKEMLIRVIIITFAVAFTLMFTVFRKQIANGLHPAANSIHNLPAGWLIPIAIMIILSFPPLFGQEIIAIMCGLVWGIWVGFAIIAAGTVLGELICFLVFRYACTIRGRKLEQKSIQYACLAKVVRQGGFLMVLIMRYSAIPSHFTTAIFSACGIPLWSFCLAAILSLPTQFVNVYLGFTLSTSSDNASEAEKVTEKIVLALTIIATVVGMWYIKKRIRDVMPEVIHARRKARQSKLAGEFAPEDSSYGNGGV